MSSGSGMNLSGQASTKVYIGSEPTKVGAEGLVQPAFCLYRTEICFGLE